MKTILAFCLLCSSSSAALLWEIDSRGSRLGAGAAGEHVSLLEFTDSSGPYQWRHVLTTENVGQVVDVDAATVDQWEFILTSSNRVSFSVLMIDTTGGGDSAHIEQSYAGAIPPFTVAYSTTRYAPLLGPNISGYYLTGVTHELVSMEHTPWFDEWHTTGRQIFRFYGEVIPAVPGDFNNNGEVDAADYVLWRNRNGTDGSLPNESGMTPLDVMQEDYDFWRSMYGSAATIAASGLSAAAIPEPSTIMTALALMANGLLLARASKRYTGR